LGWQISLSPLTGGALKQTVEDYVSKDTDEYALIEDLKARHRLLRVYRFDIGKNTDGYSDLIEGVLEMADLAGLCRENLVNIRTTTTGCCWSAWPPPSNWPPPALRSRPGWNA
jgi:histidinol-phosphate aminotransferase